MSIIEKIVTDIIDQYQSNKTKNILVGISGIECSGKSTLADKLKQLLEKKKIPTKIIHGDDFLFDKETRNKNPKQDIGYYCETFDYNKLFTELLIPIKNNTLFESKLCLLDWENDIYSKFKFQTNQPTIILVEGVFLFKKDLPKIFDLSVWIDITFELGMQRALNRSRDKNYYGNSDAILQRYTERFHKGQKIHLKLDKPIENCDFIIGGLTNWTY